MTQNQSFTLAVGQAFQCEADIFIIEWCDDKIAHLRHGLTGELRALEVYELVAMYVERTMLPLDKVQYELAKQGGPTCVQRDFAPLYSDLSEPTRLRGDSVIYFIEQLRRLGYTCLRPTPLLQMDFVRLKKELQTQGKKFEDLELSTVYRYSLLIKQAGGDLRAAYPNFSNRGGRGDCRLHTDAKNAVSTKFNELRGNGGRISFSAIHLDVKRQILIQNPGIEIVKEIPSLSTIARLTKAEFSPYEIALRNHGRAYANKKFRDWYPRNRADNPLSVVEFDDKDSRVFIVDGATNLPFGRGFITAGVDQATSVPLGLSIGTKPRSTQSALETFRDCLLPKHALVAQNGLQKEVVTFFGPPGMAVFDNALYNHAHALESAITDTAGSIIAWSKPRTPTEKSVVEDFNGRCVNAFQDLPGFGGPKNQREQLSEALLASCMTIKDFRAHLYKWVYSDFCNTPRADGLTPMQLWHDRMRTTESKYPLNLDSFDAAFATTKSCCLRPGGILHNKLIYQSDRLMTLRRNMGSEFRVTFRVPLNTLERVYVLDPQTNKYFEVPSANLEYTKGLTAYQHNQIRKIARENGQKNPSFLDLMAARADLQHLVAQLRLSKKRHERKAGVHYANEESLVTVPSTKQSKIEIVTDIEHQLDELEKVVLDDDEDWELQEDE